MGWCSATTIFDDVAGFVPASSQSDDDKIAVLTKPAGALEDGDWDCQQDSDYYDDPIVQRVFRALHPRWFEETD